MKKLLLLVFLCFPFALVAQNTGVGTSNPLEFFSVGASSQFRVNSSGNIVRINDVAYSFPASQATTGSILANDGTGNLTWTKVTAGNISATGTPSSSTYLRGDGSWQTPAGGSAPTVVGTTNFNSLTVNTTDTNLGGAISIVSSGTYLIQIQFNYTSSPGQHLDIRIQNGATVLAGNVAVINSATLYRSVTFVVALSGGESIQTIGKALSNTNNVVDNGIVTIVKLL